MRTLSWISRAVAAGAAIVAVMMIVGGSYFVGFVSEVQRSLNDPASASQLASTQMSSIEQSLGYAGYLKSYRSYRLTGDPGTREQMARGAMEAARNLDVLRKIYSDTPSATRALNDVASVIEAFAQVARSAPDMGPAALALRGTPAMEALETLPQPPQLEATYLTLRTAMERLRSQTQAHQMGGVAWALSWSQMLIVGVLALLTICLLVAAGLLQMGITQPLKMLERSLESVGNGQVTQPVWGTERQDEIGMLARAGEKLRHSLTETDALKALAQKGEVHITLNGDASVLLEKLAAGVTSAADALKSATTELNGMQSEQRARFDDALRNIGRFGSRIDEVADEIRTRATGSIDEAVADATSGMRDALDRMIGNADERTRRLGQVAGEFEQNGKLLAESVSLIRDRTATAVEGITTSMLAFKKAADGAESIQGAFFSACDRISSDAASTAENIRNLATQLYGAVENVDGRLNQKLEALDRIEAGIESALGAIRTRAEETTSAIIEASAALERHSAEAERRVGETVDGIDEVVRLFREDAPVNQSLPSRAVEDFQQIERSITRVAEIQATEYRELSSVIDNLNQVVEKLTILTHQTSLEQSPTDRSLAGVEDLLRIFGDDQNQIRSDATQIIDAIHEIEQKVDLTVETQTNGNRELADLVRRLGETLENAPALQPAAPQSSGLAREDLDALTQAFSDQLGNIRNDLRDLALRITEERIMLTADMPATAIPHSPMSQPAEPQRSMADMPMSEIMGKLRDLAEEMNAASAAAASDPALSLKGALGAFAKVVKAFRPGTDSPATLRKLAQTFSRHADEIEAGAGALKPSATALRTELQSITADLRSVARSAQDADAGAALVLNETVTHLGARAESLFSYLSQTLPAPSPVADDAERINTIEQATSDLTTLARIIGNLEQRTTELSDTAVAETLSRELGGVNPSESGTTVAGAGAKSDAAINTVYEAIERLNNIASALARADDAGRNRKAVG